MRPILTSFDDTPKIAVVADDTTWNGWQRPILSRAAVDLLFRGESQPYLTAFTGADADGLPTAFDIEGRITVPRYESYGFVGEHYDFRNAGLCFNFNGELQDAVPYREWQDGQLVMHRSTGQFSRVAGSFWNTASRIGYEALRLDGRQDTWKAHFHTVSDRNAVSVSEEFAAL